MVDTKLLRKYKLIGNVEYADLTPLFDASAEFKIVNGGRGTGKSYSIKCACVLDFFVSGAQVALVRRWKDDFVNDWATKYFADVDIQTLSSGKCNAVRKGRGGQITAGTVDDAGEYTPIYCIGYCFALNTAEHDKSAVYTNVKSKNALDCGCGEVRNVIFEEYVSEKGRYIPNEDTEFQELLSTLFRGQTDGRTVFMIGNLISKINPYFLNWNLSPVTKAKAGELMLFSTEDGTIAFYMADAGSQPKKRNPFAIGKNRKHITGNTWVTNNYPLIRDIEKYKILDLSTPVYSIYFGGADVMFIARLYLHSIDGGRFPVLTVTPTNKTVSELTHNRVIKLNYVSINPLHGNNLVKLNDGDKIMFEMITDNKVWFSDNTTGQDFNDLIKALAKGMI